MTTATRTERFLTRDETAAMLRVRPDSGPVCRERAGTVAGAHRPETADRREELRQHLRQLRPST
jgi:hypothetical protein